MGIGDVIPEELQSQFQRLIEDLQQKDLLLLVCHGLMKKQLKDYEAIKPNLNEIERKIFNGDDATSGIVEGSLDKTTFNFVNLINHF